MTRRTRVAIGVVGALGAASLAIALQLGERSFSGSTDHPAIEYARRPTSDAVSTLARRMTSGEVQPTFEARAGYLRSVLQALDVPIESQILVFSKTGIQSARTGPATPRALYFNDEVVVGFIRDAPLLELASHDPQQGVIFHTLSQRQGAPPSLRRNDRCLTCHQSFASLDVPGLLVRSHFVDAAGAPLRQLGDVVVDHRTPVDRRWGGWYVTGGHGALRHRGNTTIEDVARPEAAITPETLTRRTPPPRLEADGYPSAQSDVVALLVFEHQAHAINLMTRVGWEARVAGDEPRRSLASGPLADAVRELADYLLFVDEAPLTAPITGTSDFATTFSRRGRRDRAGRSLRDLDLRTRLLRVPCSYMIDTPAFAALPSDVRDAVYRRMWTMLSGRDADARSRHLSAADRRAIVEVLVDTHAGWPAAYR